jgi:hypothetical protein
LRFTFNFSITHVRECQNKGENSDRNFRPERLEEADKNNLYSLKWTDFKNTKFSFNGSTRISSPIEGGEGRETAGSIQIVLTDFTSNSAEQNIDPETVAEVLISTS